MTRRTRLAVSAAALAALGFGAFFHASPRFIWNASASVPIGLYRLEPVTQLARGDLVAAQTPDQFAHLFATRGYLPIGVPLLKYVAALPGQTVCRTGLRITIDGKRVATARHFDRKGRALPQWRGCILLTQDHVFLLNPKIRESLDGRYFGAVSRQSIVGRATPLWAPLTHMRSPNVQPPRTDPALTIHHYDHRGDDK